jgi:hypothetical protein
MRIEYRCSSLLRQMMLLARAENISNFNFKNADIGLNIFAGKSPHYFHGAKALTGRIRPAGPSLPTPVLASSCYAFVLFLVLIPCMFLVFLCIVLSVLHCYRIFDCYSFVV